MPKFSLGSPRPIVQLAGLVLASLLILGACAPLPGPTVELTPSLEPAAPTPLVTPSPTPTAAPKARATAAGAAPPATLVDVALRGLVFVRADGALVRRSFSTDEDVVLLPPGAYAAEGDAASMVPIGWPLRASADARWLLVPTPDQGAWLVSWDGQVQRRINAERLSATWAPDNQRIVFIYQTGAPPRARDNEVYVQNVVSGGEARLLTRLSQPVGYIFWSPACPGLGSGGADACAERIAAVTCAKDAPDVVCTVWLLDAGSAASRALGQFRPAAIGIAPINFGWAPSGTAFYVGIAADGPLAFPVDGGGPRPLVGNLPGLAQRQPAAYPLLSPDGTRLAQLQPSAAKQGGQALVILDVRANTAIHQSAPYPGGATVAGWLNDDVALIRYVENDAQILAGMNIASGETQKLVYSDVFIGSWRQLMTRSTEVSAIEGRLVDQPGSGPAPDPVAHEAALVQAILPVNTAYPVCEWQELGQQGDEIYVWTVCLGLLPVGGKTGASLPAVLVLGADGSVHAVRLPGDGSQYAEDIKKLFPPAVRALIAEAQTYVPELVLRAERRLAAAQP